TAVRRLSFIERRIGNCRRPRKGAGAKAPARLPLPAFAEGQEPAMTDPYVKPEVIDPDVIANLGPLAALVGIWEGEQGVDVAPARGGDVVSRYRERLSFEPWGPVNNHAQTLYGLRYMTMVWRLGETGAYHDEVGYWLWDPERQLVMRCFAVPR